MKEIKSFREYIKEQEEFKNQILSEDAPVGTNMLVADIQLKLTKKDPNERLDELDEKVDALKRTYDDLDRFVTASGFTNVGPSDGRAKINITNGKSFTTIFNDWYYGNEEKGITGYSNKIESQRKNREHIGDVNTLMKLGHKKNKAVARENLSDIYPKTKPNAEKKENKNEEVTEEGTIYEAFKLTNPFNFVGEYASGSKNKYNSSRVLTRLVRSKAGREEDAVGKKGIYGDFDNSKRVLSNVGEFERMKRSYEKNAYAIIAKQKGIGLSYLNRAKKTIDDYKVRKRYLKKITDEEYLSNIADDVGRAMNKLTDIGTDLQNLMAEYTKSLNKISNELRSQDYKARKYITGLNAQQAVGKQDNKEAKAEQKKAEKEENREIEQSKIEEKFREFSERLDKVANEISKTEDIDVNSTNEFFKYLEKFSKRDEITPEFILDKLETESNKKTENKKSITTEERLAKLQALYLMSKLLIDNKLKDYKVGPTAMRGNLTVEKKKEIYDILSPLSLDDIDDLVPKIKKVLTSSNEIKKYIENRESEKKEQDLKKSEEVNKKVSELAHKKINELVNNNNLGSLNYNFIMRRVSDDLEDSGKPKSQSYYSKVDKFGLAKADQEKASAIVSYVLLNMIKNNLINKYKKGDLTAEMRVETYFRNAFSQMKDKFKNESSEFNKSLKTITSQFLNSPEERKKNEALRAASDTEEKDNEKEDSESEEEKLRAVGQYAKDFDGEAPEKSQPKNIFDYAVQKAKKLQEK